MGPIWRFSKVLCVWATGYPNYQYITKNTPFESQRGYCQIWYLYIMFEIHSNLLMAFCGWFIRLTSYMLAISCLSKLYRDGFMRLISFVRSYIIVFNNLFMSFAVIHSQGLCSFLLKSFSGWAHFLMLNLKFVTMNLISMALLIMLSMQVTANMVSSSSTLLF